MIARHPSRALGYRGDHPLAWRNFRLEMRSDHAIISPNEPVSVGTHPGRNFGGRNDRMVRSEEHTSELQSRFDLVCRLLLEKKKKRLHHICTTTIYTYSIG